MSDIVVTLETLEQRQIKVLIEIIEEMLKRHANLGYGNQSDLLEKLDSIKQVEEL
jgi:hypothetical protein